MVRVYIDLGIPYAQYAHHIPKVSIVSVQPMLTMITPFS